MTDTWAAKVLEGVPRCDPFWNRLVMIAAKDGDYVEYDDALAAIAKLGAGDGLVERAEAALEGVTDGPWAVEYKYGTIRLLMGNEVAMCDEKYYPWTPENDKDWHFIAFTRQWVPEAAARIAALTAQVANAQKEHEGWQSAAMKLMEKLSAAEAERDALRAKVARLEGAIDYILDGMAISAPEYAIDPDDDFLDAANADWVRDTVSRLAAAISDGAADE